MRITQVRNATVLIEFAGLMEFAGLRVLVDPMLGAKGSQPGFLGVRRNPLVDLPVPLDDLVHPDVVVVTHTHPDHWDAAAAALLPRDVPMLVQHAGDRQILLDAGFEDVTVLNPSHIVSGTTFTRTGGQHGSDETLAARPGLGEVMGVVIGRPGERTVYIAGDTVLTGAVEDAVSTHRPDVIVLNTGEAVLPGLDPILMGADDVVSVNALAPAATLVAVHMEALDHCTVTRAHVRETAAAHGISGVVLVPEDGETLEV
ncbi:MBL fold metallo-hydrolase [Microbacterium radiodurans]|uniref:MBL fold metallo-hydrolase n=1 Tax=Microbacterium radiodurans TaxID=661398 RepID=A0A5J5IVX5_9MICO|nr:MBL fold metallo-hydrolase [Microbacterium radiodurans]KAA9089406.1 MBL fold metallo-hydrolase [Microbacterium radiodurans]